MEHKRTLHSRLPIRNQPLLTFPIGSTISIFLPWGSNPLHPDLTDAADVYAFLKDELPTWNHERWLTLILDHRGRLIGLNERELTKCLDTMVSVDSAMSHLRLRDVRAFALAHNHVSGDPTPSTEDISITGRMKEIADRASIRFVDHIIIGKGRYVSFVDDGYW